MLLTNIIITGDEAKRAWFTQYLKCMQQKVSESSCCCILEHSLYRAGAGHTRCNLVSLHIHQNTKFMTLRQSVELITFCMFVSLLTSQYRKHRLSAVTQLRSFLMRKLHSFLKSPRDSAPQQQQLLTQQSSEDSSDEEVKSKGSPEKAKELGLESLEDLVDQMEIEISDHEEQKTDVASKGEESTEVKGQDKPKAQLKKRVRKISTFERVEFRAISLDYQLCDDDIIDLMQLLQVCFN